LLAELGWHCSTSAGCARSGDQVGRTKVQADIDDLTGWTALDMNARAGRIHRNGLQFAMAIRRCENVASFPIRFSDRVVGVEIGEE
jgi:hypothetical protein